MVGYVYDAITKEYQGEVPLSLNVEETERRGYETYVVPPNVTRVPPPVIDKDETATFDGTSWTLYQDFRGETIYDSQGEAKVVTDIGPLPKGWTLAAPSAPDPYTYYEYSPETGELLRSGTVTINEAVLLPPQAVTLVPPQAGANEIAVFAWEAWTLQPDYRGKTMYAISDGSSQVVTQIGPISDGYVLDAPPARKAGQAATYDGTSWTVVDDYRGQVIYDGTGQRQTVTALGPLPDGWLTSAPPDLTPDQVAEIKKGVWVVKTKPLADRVESVLTARRLRYGVESDPLMLEALLEESQGNTSVAAKTKAKAVAAYTTIKTELPKPTK